MLNTSTSSAIAGAIELLLGKRAGLGRFDLSADGFWNSFTAALYAVPLYAFVIAGDWQMLSMQAQPPALSTLILVRFIELALDFAAVPVVLALLARRLKITRSYGTFVIVRNWAMLVILAPQTVVSLLFGFGWLPNDAVALLSLVIIVIALIYSYRITRWTLNWSPGAAVGLVAAELVLGQIVISLINGWFGL